MVVAVVRVVAAACEEVLVVAAVVAAAAALEAQIYPSSARVVEAAQRALSKASARG